MRARRTRRGRDGRGQSMVELALLLPSLCFLLLGVVDFARAYSTEQRLEQGAHLATLKLLTNPGLDLNADIAAEAGLPAGSVTTRTDYAADSNGNNHIILTAQYDYPLLLPGLQKLRTRTLTNGKLHITVSATGIARTDPPAIVNHLPLSDCPSSTSLSYCLVVTPATGSAATPSDLGMLTCLLYKNGSPVTTQPSCGAAAPSSSSSSSWLAYGINAADVAPTDKYTATVVQSDGVVSLPSVSWSPS